MSSPTSVLLFSNPTSDNLTKRQIPALALYSGVDLSSRPHKSPIRGFAQTMDSLGTKVPVASSDDYRVPKELKPLHDYYEEWNKEMSGTWSNLVSEKVE